MGKSESYPGKGRDDGLESGVHVFAQTGGGEEKAPEKVRPSLPAPSRLVRALAPCRRQAGKAKLPSAGSSQGRLHARGGT